MTAPRSPHTRSPALMPWSQGLNVEADQQVAALWACKGSASSTCHSYAGTASYFHLEHWLRLQPCCPGSVLYFPVPQFPQSVQWKDVFTPLLLITFSFFWLLFLCFWDLLRFRLLLLPLSGNSCFLGAIFWVRLSASFFIFRPWLFTYISFCMSFPDLHVILPHNQTFAPSLATWPAISSEPPDPTSYCWAGGTVSYWLPGAIFHLPYFFSPSFLTFSQDEDLLQPKLLGARGLCLPLYVLWVSCRTCP